MAETFCGKSCLECSRQRELNCPGCRVGPGREVGGACEVARCVRTRGHESCGTCVQRPRCGMYQGRDHQADYRIQRQKNAAHLQQAIADRAPFLGKWLWILFWLIVPSTIANLMTQEVFQNYSPVVYSAGQVLKVVCTLAYGLILWKLSQQEEDYRTAAICFLIAGGINLAAGLIPSGQSSALALVISIPAVIVGLCGEYKEYMAHSAVLQGVNSHLSGKWESLRKWYIGSYVGIFLSVLLMFIPILGAIAMLGCAVALVVVSVMKLVYLYQTAKAFREFDPALMEGV